MGFFTATGPATLAAKTLILPIVSVANLPQLASDLLIRTLTLERIGFLDSKHLVPVIGGSEDGIEGITTALEVYGKNDSNIVVIQQRSPVIKANKEDFTADLVRWINEAQFGAVLVLVGADVTNRTDSQMHTPAYYLLPRGAPALDNSPLAPLTKLLPLYQPPPGSSDIFVPGGGLARRFMLAMSDSTSTVHVGAIVQFALEGDNREDSKLLTGLVNQVLQIGVKEWKEPQSWKTGLFGTPHDQTLFG